jgi:hypothetical protein
MMMMMMSPFQVAQPKLYLKTKLSTYTLLERGVVIVVVVPVGYYTHEPFDTYLLLPSPTIISRASVQVIFTTQL